MKAALTIFLALACLTAPAATHTAYDLTIKVEPGQHRLTVSGTAELVPATKDKNEIVMVYAEQMKPSNVRLLAPTDMAGDASITETGSFSGHSGVRLKLPRTLKKGERLKIAFRIEGGDKIAPVFHIGPEGSFAGGPNTAWYPMFGDLIGTLPNARLDADRTGTATLVYDVPAEEVVISTGKKISVEKANGRAIYKYSQQQPAAISFASAKYKVYESPGTPPVAVYTLTDIPEPQKYVDGCRRVVDELSKIFGPFPYPEFALVEVDDDKASKASFGGAAMAGHMLSNTSFLKEGFNLAFFGHEIGHQWWGNLVRLGSDDGGYLLDEALAQYGSLWCVDKIGSAQEAARYRRDGYPGYIQRQSREGFLNLHAAGMDYPLRKMPTSGISHTLADSKGLMIYHMLGREIGEERFHAVLKEITREYAYGRIPFKDFLALVDKHAKQDMSWFWNQWLDRKGAPYLELSRRPARDGVEVTIRQEAPFYRMLVPVHATSRDGTRSVHWIRVEDGSTTATIKGHIERVELDAEARVLAFDATTRGRSIAYKKLIEAAVAFNASKLDEAMVKVDEVLGEVPTPDVHGVEFYANYLKAGIHRTKKEFSEAKSAYLRALTMATKNDYYVPWAYLHLMRVAKELKDGYVEKWCARQAISAEQALKQHTSITREAEKVIKSSGDTSAS